MIGLFNRTHGDGLPKQFKADSPKGLDRYRLVAGGPPGQTSLL